MQADYKVFEAFALLIGSRIEMDQHFQNADYLESIDGLRDVRVQSCRACRLALRLNCRKQMEDYFFSS
jgi:hypothetical protein